ncbi:zinc ribbon domain-containing protein [Neorhodopirellula lusitana]|uniref:zinc-ribbon domain-containing protein n=1 Tax=Neorhodopirellula lusitana TaxID=445327 RepID=UPI00384C45BB
MILIGTMNLTRTRETGVFYCPTCNVSQPYRLRARRPFLTLYFIPTVPIGNPELFVVCDHCKNNWDESVLHLDQAAHQQIQAAQFQDEAIRSAVLVTLQGEDISEPEIQCLIHISNVLFDRPIDREELGRLCSIARRSNIQATNYVLTVSKRWTMQQKLLALQGMFLAATAQSETIPDETLATLIEMRELLQLSDQEFRIAIDDTLDYEMA